MRVSNYRPVHRQFRAPWPCRHVLNEDGRRGPRWLHRLVFNMAARLGMLRANLETEITYRPVDLGTAHRAVMDAALGYMDDGIMPEDLVVYIGPKAWHEHLMHDSGMSFVAEEEFGHRRLGQRICTIRCFTIPEVEGVLVVPHPRTMGFP